MLDGAQVVPHLLRRGLVTSADCARARPVIDRVPGRNFLYRVGFDTGAAFLLKQAVDPQTRQALDREARMYDHLAAWADRALIHRLARKLDYDPDDRVLVLEFLNGYRQLAARPTRSRHPDADPGAAAELGRALRELSSLPPPPLDSRPPWILSLIHPSVEILREATPGMLDLARSIQGSRIWCESLERLALEWSPRSTVHGDLRFSNVLVRSGRIAARPSDLVLVDWELAGPGSAAWDAGWVIAGILIEHHGRIGAGFPLLRAFWSAYADGPVPVATLSWAAAAILQRAYEAAREHPCPSNRVKRLLEVGRSLIERSEVWSESVFLPSQAGACQIPGR